MAGNTGRATKVWGQIGVADHVIVAPESVGGEHGDIWNVAHTVMRCCKILKGRFRIALAAAADDSNEGRSSGEATAGSATAPRNDQKFFTQRGVAEAIRSVGDSSQEQVDDLVGTRVVPGISGM